MGSALGFRHHSTHSCHVGEVMQVRLTMWEHFRGDRPQEQGAGRTGIRAEGTQVLMATPMPVTVNSLLLVTDRQH